MQKKESRLVSRARMREASVWWCCIFDVFQQQQQQRLRYTNDVLVHTCVTTQRVFIAHGKRERDLHTQNSWFWNVCVRVLSDFLFSCSCSDAVEFHSSLRAMRMPNQSRALDFFIHLYRHSIYSLGTHDEGEGLNERREKKPLKKRCASTPNKKLFACEAIGVPNRFHFSRAGYSSTTCAHNTGFGWWS